MPLEPYQTRQPLTPKSGSPSPNIGLHKRHASGGSSWSSPDSVATRATTPSASPLKHNGPGLLPKIRTQDQGLDSCAGKASSHRRAVSHDCDPHIPAPSHRPDYQRSTTCPPDYNTEPTPISATSTVDQWFGSAEPSPVTYSFNARKNFGQGRSISSTSIDPAALCRRFPNNYRTYPEYITQAPSQYISATTVGPEEFISIPTSSTPQPIYRALTPELEVLTGNEPTSTLSAYLTEPNPPLNLVPRHLRGPGDGTAKHCWWDVRNLVTWTDFNLDTIVNIPDFAKLLALPLNTAALPTPATLPTTSSHPQDINSLQSALRNHHIAKVNSALRSTQLASHHIAIEPAASRADGPHFIANYADDVECTLAGNGRARVVGLVKPYESWNSGKRNEKGQVCVEYLKHLAHLQEKMRANNCRYGYIITEIELVCVRMGTEEGTPYFGFLELSKPIEMKTSGKNGKPKLTAALALWYLHMLAGDRPLEGQKGWKVDVGLPALHTRSLVMTPGDKGRDEWMPKFTEAEKRHARMARGWAMPEDPVNRIKEGVVVSKGRKA